MFVARSSLLELLCWALLAANELGARLDPFGGGSLLLESSRGVQLVDAYERLVYNETWDLEQALPAAVALLIAAALLRRCARSGRRPPKAVAWEGEASLSSIKSA